MIGVEFVEDRETKAYAEKLRDRIVENAFRRGLLLLGCGKSTVRISPPLCVTRDEIDEAMEIFDEAITVSESETLTLVA
jgi:4-aminobutyrate aminotransferase